MSYHLKADPKNSIDGDIIKFEGDELLYRVPFEGVLSFEQMLKWNCLPIKQVSADEEWAVYSLPASEFVFQEAELYTFNPLATFSGAILKLEEAIEVSGNKDLAIEWATLSKTKKEFEEFLKVNSLFFEFLQEETVAVYLISRSPFENRPTT